jgi:hypothetical protein
VLIACQNNQMGSAMSSQVEHDEAVSRRLQQPWSRVVILERLARGGGTSRWYYATSNEQIKDVLNLLRGGSVVSLFFGDELNVEIDSDEARQRMFDRVSPSREIMVAYPQDNVSILQVELVTGASELTELLIHHPEGKTIVWGPWPSAEPNGLSSFTLRLVDEDGVLRIHPH